MSLIAAIALLAQPAEAAGLPLCAELTPDIPHQDCRAVTASGAEIAFAFAPAEFGETVTVTVRGADGAEFARYAFETESFFYPRVEDVDADTVDDILVPRITGTVNTDWALMFGVEDGFSAPLSVNGHTIAPVEPGLFSVHARQSAAAHVAEFYTFNGEHLVTDAIVAIEMGEAGAACRLVSGGEFRGEAFYCDTLLSND